MDDILLLEAIERYLNGEMNPDERAYFEALRKKTPEIDQMVVEHNMFLHQMEYYTAHRNIKHTLQSTSAQAQRPRLRVCFPNRCRENSGNHYCS